MLKFIPFQKAHVDQAAHLLSAQFVRLRTDHPLLPQRTEEPSVAGGFLNALYAQETCCGIVMLENDEMQGFLLGTFGDNQFFGEHVLVPFGGIAIASGRGAETLAMMYVAAGKCWVEEGVLNHYLVLPALPDWLDVAFSLSFGKEQAYALASMTELRPKVCLPTSIEIREAEPGDADALADCADWIIGHYNRAPVWEPVPADYLMDLRKGYAELAEEEESTTWIALDGEQIVSFMVIGPEEIALSSLFGEPGVTHFPVAATHPAYRGRGIGRALFTHVMNLASGLGAKCMTTDWRTTNLSASRTWSRFGFQPYAYRLIRRANPRYQEYI